jgi:NSS family neurotransmitter:Na+ symporter
MFEGKTFFDLFDYIVTNVMMPLGGILIAVFAGWMVKREFSRDELFDGKDVLAHKAWLILVRFVAPAILAFVFFDMALG